MNIYVERLPECRAIMRVEVPSEIVKKERSEVVAKFAQLAKLPGFRPGKVPPSVIEKRYAKQIQEEVQSKLVEQGYREGLEREKLEVLGVRVEEPEFHLDDTFSVVLQIQTAPDFELPDYKGIPVEVVKIEVSEDAVDAEMEQLRAELAQFEDIEGRAAEMGDFLVLDYGSVLDGEPLDAENFGQLAKGEDAWLNLSEDSFLPGFCANLVGMSVGESKDFDYAMSEDFQAEELQGKTLQFHVEVKGLKRQVIPELSDELAAQVEEDLTVETLRERVRERLRGVQEMERKEEVTTQIMEFLDEELQFELPQNVVMGETQRQVNEIARNIVMRGATEEDLEEKKDEIISIASQQAEVNVKTNFILDQIAKKEKIEATEDEIVGMCAQLAAANQVSLNAYVKQVEKSKGFGQIANRIVNSKTLEFLCEHASVSETDPPEADSEETDASDD